ncbi:HWE histidine kinase domain-containing protein [uncultured Parasphingorhabdus sp.]|uniref:sensor histidine kinase n=1 Tax=uncultured Parasphingorhabdus sp. TaxID=2709694 RepID=UPI0030DCBC82|tara:strand:+ start:61116 stop:62621 length:1506 start_codon:yes stop_codon:yes gene_type:complete
MSAGNRVRRELHPSIETERLATLSSYQIMDSAPEEAFDRITRLVADIFSAPMASIAFFDDSREWFKSVVGLPPVHIDRRVSLCTELIEGREPLVIEDIEKEQQFSDNPLVTGDTSLRFYAGAPLIAPSGLVLGALSIGDTVPRFRISKNQLNQLRSLADIVMSEMELRREIILREQAQKNAAIARSNLDLTLALSDVGSFRIDLETGLIDWGGAYMKIWGEDAGEAITEVESALARVHPDDQEAVRQAMGLAVAPGEKFQTRFRIILPSGEIRWVEGYGDYLEANGRPTLTGINKDITHSVDQQEQLRLHTRELHHRLRNLFATLQSIMSLTKNSATSIDDYIERIKSRLSALNRAQQILLDTNFVTGSFAALVRDLCQTYPRVRWSGPDFSLSENAMVSISLVLNELATNAVKYGALTSGKGLVKIDWAIEEENGQDIVHLTWTERGGPTAATVPSTFGFGSSLIDHSITRNLRGEITRDWTADGLLCTVVFPVPEDQVR